MPQSDVDCSYNSSMIQNNAWNFRIFVELLTRRQHSNTVVDLKTKISRSCDMSNGDFIDDNFTRFSHCSKFIQNIFAYFLFAFESMNEKLK